MGSGTISKFAEGLDRLQLLDALSQDKYVLKVAKRSTLGAWQLHTNKLTPARTGALQYVDYGNSLDRGRHPSCVAIPEPGSFAWVDQCWGGCAGLTCCPVLLVRTTVAKRRQKTAVSTGCMHQVF